MMKHIVTMFGAVLIASSVMAGAVTNTVKWNVPWGDAYRTETQKTLDAYETQVNADAATLAAGSGAIALTSNQVLIGSSAGVAAAQTLSGLFTVDTGGVASATSSGSAATNGTVAVTPQAPGAVTPTITVTPQAPAAHTPTITVTPTTGAVTASGANDLVTPTATITLYTGIGYDSTGVAITNAAGDVMDIVTNVTCAITPDLASNAVVVVTVTGGSAVMTSATAASSELPVFATNATAVCSELPVFATNATAVFTPQTATFVKP